MVTRTLLNQLDGKWLRPSVEGPSSPYIMALLLSLRQHMSEKVLQLVLLFLTYSPSITGGASIIPSRWLHDA